MLTPAQREAVRRNLNTLDYLQGTGVISTSRNRLVEDSVFLFISAGGTGCKALVDLKKTMEREVDASCIKDQVMFLAVDSAHEDLNAFVVNGELGPNEILKIPYVGAHASINPSNVNPGVKAWVHPDLWMQTGGHAADITPPPTMNGSGAGAWRQVGRVLMNQPQTINQLQKIINAAMTRLVGGKSVPKVRVFILSGISGGTGSGIVFDLTYAVRQILSNFLAAHVGKLNISGYIFLPSAVASVHDSVEMATGNRNAYAALKEIDYFMTLGKRGVDTYTYTLGSLAVNVNTNIFDFCVLVEGNGMGAFFLDPADTARKVVASSIIDIICANEAKMIGAAKSFMTDSFFSNYEKNVDQMLHQTDDSTLPRDTNYIYNVIGTSACIIPKDLLLVYVANEVLQVLFQSYKNAEDATDNKAKNFLIMAGMRFDDLKKNYKNVTTTSLAETIDSLSDKGFKANGPFYMVNLLNKAADLIDSDPDFKPAIQKERRKLFKNEAQLTQTEKLYKAAKDIIVKLNGSFYMVYTYVIREIKALIERNTNLLTETHEFQNVFGSSFSWTPVDMRQGSDAKELVETYLNELIPHEDIRKAAAVFVKELLDQKDQWVQFAEEPNGVKFDAAGMIRNYIANNFSALVNSKVEEFLIRVYQPGLPDYQVKTVNDSGQEVPSEATDNTARIILNELSAKASALIQLRPGVNQSLFYKKVYLTVPSSCKWLKQAFEGQTNAVQDLAPSDIFGSSAEDKIVLTRHYAGVPAWAANWTSQAEDNYEGNVNAVGLHMEQAEGSKDWINFPNLYPAKLWTNHQRTIRKREEKIEDEVKLLMEEAENLGALKTHDEPAGTREDYMDIVLMNMNNDLSAQELYEKADLVKSRVYSLTEVFDILVEKGVLQNKKIEYVGMVMTKYDDQHMAKMSTDEMVKSRFDMACRTLRRSWDNVLLLRKSIPAFKELKKIIRDNSPVDITEIVAFKDALSWGLVSYQDLRAQWFLNVDDQRTLGKPLKTKMEKMLSIYNGFVAFTQLDQETKDAINQAINEKFTAEGPEAEAAIAVQACFLDDLRQYLTSFRNAKSKNECPWPENSPFAKDGNKSPWPMASFDFESNPELNGKANVIRDFYNSLIQQL